MSFYHSWLLRGKKPQNSSKRQDFHHRLPPAKPVTSFWCVKYDEGHGVGHFSTFLLLLAVNLTGSFQWRVAALLSAKSQHLYRKTTREYQPSHPEGQTSLTQTYQGISWERKIRFLKVKLDGNVLRERGCDGVSWFCNCKQASLMTGGEWYTMRWNADPPGPLTLHITMDFAPSSALTKQQVTKTGFYL